MDQNDIKKRVTSAIDRYNLRQTKTSEPKRHNQKPEKDTEKSVLEYMRSLGCLLSVIESKAVYSQSAGRYLSGQVLSGYPDVVGVNPSGIFLGIELKALGCRSTLKNHQRLFLTQIIYQNGFACCTDSVHHISSLYSRWLTSDVETRKILLIQDLPVKRAEGKTSKPLFDNVD